MRMKDFNTTGVTLMEILLAAIIFIITVGGIFATLNAVRTPVTQKENALTAAVFGKQVLDTLRANVKPSTFDANCTPPCAGFNLKVGLHQVTMPAGGLNWPSADLASANNYLSYTVTCGDDGTTYPCTPANEAHKVVLNVNW